MSYPLHDIPDERLTPRERPWYPGCGHCACGARHPDECDCDRRGIEDEEPQEPEREPEDGPLTRAMVALRTGLERDMRAAGLYAPPLIGERHG